jgi:predicted enzyme related to lactoylglutathione lyase
MAGNHGPFIWYEYASADTARAAEFLHAVIPWQVAKTDMPGLDYTVLNAPDGGVGGLVSTANGRRPGWLGYVAVSDVDATVAECGRLGGAVLVPAMDIPDVGRFAVIADPGGAALAVMTPRSDATWDAESLLRPGHCRWHELFAWDGQKAMDFYAALFGWTRSTAMDMGPMGTYQIFAHDGTDLGGIMTMTKDMPAPLWNFYFHVDALDAAADRARTHGASLLMGPHQVPGGAWVVQMADPDGQLLSLLSMVK